MSSTPNSPQPNEAQNLIQTIGSQWNVTVAAEFLKVCGQRQRSKGTIPQGVEVQKAVKYGKDPRRRLDVYQPANKTGSAPVVVYFHGGGFSRGDNDLRVDPNDTSYTPFNGHIGYLFASHGFVTCLATYRLVGSGAEFPSGPEDVAVALTWVRDNIHSYDGDGTNVVAIGHSAGGTHLANALFLGQLEPPNSAPLLKGVVLFSAPLGTFCSTEERMEVASQYFKTSNLWELQERFSSNALFRQAYFGDGKGTAPKDSLPCKLLLIAAEIEEDEIAQGIMGFMQDFQRRFGLFAPLHVVPRHNHISYLLELGLDDADVLILQSNLLRFIRECIE